jgi:hypothetical protein
MTRLLDEGEDAQPYFTEADDRSPWARRFEQGVFEDDAWGDPGVIGVVVAILIIVVVVVAGLWLDGHQTALTLLGGPH